MPRTLLENICCAQCAPVAVCTTAESTTTEEGRHAKLRSEPFEGARTGPRRFAILAPGFWGSSRMPVWLHAGRLLALHWSDGCELRQIPHGPRFSPRSPCRRSRSFFRNYATTHEGNRNISNFPGSCWHGQSQFSGCCFDSAAPGGCRGVLLLEELLVAMESGRPLIAHRAADTSDLTLPSLSLGARSKEV